MTCPKCSHRNKPGANFCLRCGQTLEPVPVRPPSRLDAENPSGLPVHGLKTYRQGLFALAAALLIILSGLVYVMLRIGRDEPVEVFAPSTPAADAPVTEVSADTPLADVPVADEPLLSAEVSDDMPPNLSAQPSEASPLPDTVYPPGDLSQRAFDSGGVPRESTRAHMDERAEMACDGDMNSGWRGTAGAGDWIEFSEAEVQTFNDVVLTGAASSIKALQFSFDDGSVLPFVFSRENRAAETLTLSFGETIETTTVRITVLELWEDADSPVIREVWFCELITDN